MATKLEEGGGRGGKALVAGSLKKDFFAASITTITTLLCLITFINCYDGVR